MKYCYFIVFFLRFNTQLFFNCAYCEPTPAQIVDDLLRALRRHCHRHHGARRVWSSDRSDSSLASFLGVWSVTFRRKITSAHAVGVCLVARSCRFQRFSTSSVGVRWTGPSQQEWHVGIDTAIVEHMADLPRITASRRVRSAVENDQKSWTTKKKTSKVCCTCFPRQLT